MNVVELDPVPDSKAIAVAPAPPDGDATVVEIGDFVVRHRVVSGMPDPDAHRAGEDVAPRTNDVVVDHNVTGTFLFGLSDAGLADTHTTRAEVELSYAFDTAFGSAQTDRPGSSAIDVIAEAALQAVSEYLDESTKLCLRLVRRVALDDEVTLIVLVDLLTGRDRKTLVGASLVSGNENQTAVFATLDAVNRVLGKLELKSSVEYKIK